MPNEDAMARKSLHFRQRAASIACLAIAAGCNPTPPTRLVDPTNPNVVVQPRFLKAGRYDGTIPIDGLDRTYILRIPPHHDGTTPLPLVFMLHGGFGSAENAATHYGWQESADANGFYAVFPDGLGTIPTWNATHCCGYALNNGIDDVGFIRVLVQALGGVVPLDGQRIYAAGMSNGAMLCHRLAAEASDIFAAVAPVAGSLGGQIDQSAPVVVPPAPTGPVSVIIFHGTEDENVLFDGGPSLSPVAAGRIDLAVSDAVQFWVAADQAEATPAVESLAGGDVMKSSYAAGGTVAEVVLYAVAEQGHAWPGGLQPFPGADPPSTAISATETIWQFFASHPKP
jgi:polyhydroxybutyrate depolymerase